MDDIKGVLLHATVYCGIPAGLDAFKAANDVLKEMGTVPAGVAGRASGFALIPRRFPPPWSVERLGRLT